VTSTGQPLYQLSGVSCAYGEEDVLLDVNLQVEPGDFLGIVGPSGSGKTTLLRLLTGTVHARQGHFTAAPHFTTAYVPQVETIDWNFPVTVGECVLMARSRRRLAPWRTAAERDAVQEVLDRLGMGDLIGRHIRELSGGQQQRMFIARALVQRPDVLLMDEPTSGVDVKTRHEVLHLLEELNGQGLVIVLTTHDLNGIAAHLPRLVCLNRRVIGVGAPHEVLVPAVLEATYGASMEVLHHGGMPVVIDRYLSTAAAPALTEMVR
jgi:ABC-type Mn2+/Zn2+ transport system ATPase subunit